MEEPGNIGDFIFNVEFHRAVHRAVRTVAAGIGSVIQFAEQAVRLAQVGVAVSVHVSSHVIRNRQVLAAGRQAFQAPCTEHAVCVGSQFQMFIFLISHFKILHDFQVFLQLVKCSHTWY